MVPQWATITLRLHVGGTFVVELEGNGRKGCRAGDRALLPPGPAMRGALLDAARGPRTHVLTVTWHQTQCRPVMPW